MSFKGRENVVGSVIIPQDISQLFGTEEWKMKWLAGYEDPCLFVKYFLDERTNHFLNEKVRKHPVTGKQVQGHPIQRYILRSLAKEEVRYGAVKAGSRSGKTFAIALLHLWALFYRPRPTTSEFHGDYSKRYQQLNVAPSLKQAKLVLSEVRTLALKSPILSAMGFIEHSTEGAEPLIRTCLNSVLWGQASAMKGRNLLGAYYDVVSFDEAASEPDLKHIKDKIISGRLLEVQGTQVYISTPQGSCEEMASTAKAAEAFRQVYEAYRLDINKGDDTKVVATISAFDNPVNNPDQIQKTMLELTPTQVQEEVFGKFVKDKSTLFPIKSINTAFKRGKNLPLFIPVDKDGVCEPDAGAGDFLWLPQAKTRYKYYSGVDIAGNNGQDHTVLTTVRVVGDRIELVAFERSNVCSLLGEGGIVTRIQRRLKQFYGPSYYDSTGLVGQFLIETLDNQLSGTDEYEQLAPINSCKKPGRKSTLNYKSAMIVRLKSLLERQLIDIPDTKETAALKRELKGYRYDDAGLKTDCVMSLALACYAAYREADSYLDMGDLLETAAVRDYSFRNIRSGY